MKAEVREMLGKAAYEARHPRKKYDPHLTMWMRWEDLEEEEREVYCTDAEAAVNKLAEMLIPIVVHTLLSEEQITAILRTLEE